MKGLSRGPARAQASLCRGPSVWGRGPPRGEAGPSRCLNSLLAALPSAASEVAGKAGGGQKC